MGSKSKAVSQVLYKGSTMLLVDNTVNEYNARAIAGASCAAGSAEDEPGLLEQGCECKLQRG